MAFEAMGCSFEFVFDGRSLAGGSCESQALAEELRELVLDWHWRLSVFETGSLVSRINRAPAGLALPLDEEMFSLCMLCEQLREDTGGVFNIAAGTLMHVHGFRGLNTPTSLPGRSELGALDLDTAITLDHQKRCLIKAHDWIQLDFGAIAKGYVLDLLRSELESFGIENAFLHGGTSSVLALGEDPQRKPWMAAAGANTRVGLRGLALGVSEHGARTAQRDAVQRDAVQRDGAQFGHIMDARTKQPASNTLTRVVCVHASAAVADAYSTACSAAPELAPELSNNSCSLLAFSSSAPPALHDSLGVVHCSTPTSA